MATADELAREGSVWWASVEVQGWGRRIGASSLSKRKAYRFCTKLPSKWGFSNLKSDKYHELLHRPTSTLTSEIDLHSGRTNLGSFSFTLLDAKARDITHGWNDTTGLVPIPDDDRLGLITDLLAVQGPAHHTHGIALPWVKRAGQWALAGNMTKLGNVIAIVDTTDISVSDILWIGSEAIVVTVVGVGTITALRAKLGTEAKAHKTRANGGDGTFYDRPQYIKGRKVTLRISFRDKVTGDLFSEDDHLVVWQGIITDWELTDDYNSFTFQCSPLLGKLDTSIGRKQFSAMVGQDPDQFNAKMASGESASLGALVAIQINDNPILTDYPIIADEQVFHTRIGDSIARCSAIILFPASDDPRVDIKIHKFGLLETPMEWSGSDSQDGVSFYDILIVNPNPDIDDNPFTYFKDDDGNATTHPIDIMLAMMTSTGYIVTGVSKNGDWDMLPETWGAGVDIDDIDIDSFALYRTRLNACFPRLVIGWEGKPFELRKWLEDQFLGPLGLFLYINFNGKIAIGSIKNIFPLEDVPTLTEDDFQLEGPKMSGGLDSTIAWQTWNVNWSFKENEPMDIIKVLHREVRERQDYASSDIEFSVPGMGWDNAAIAMIQARMDQFSSLFVTPLPVIRAPVGLHRLELNLIEAISLTTTMLPNPFTGLRGLSDVKGVVLSKAIDFENSVLDLDIMLLPERFTGLWAPAGVVREYTGTTILLESNQFSDSEYPGGSVPDEDAKGLVETVSQTMLVSPEGRSRCDNVVTVTRSAANTIHLGGSQYTLLGGTIEPLPGDIIVRPHWPSGTAPAGTFASDVAAYQGDDADGELPDGTEAYVYGG